MVVGAAADSPPALEKLPISDRSGQHRPKNGLLQRNSSTATTTEKEKNQTKRKRKAFVLIELSCRFLDGGLESDARGRTVVSHTEEEYI